MATAPVFAATPLCAVAQVTTANTNRNGTGTIVTVVTAGASGSKIERVRVCATGTTTAGVVRLFINNGSSSFLMQEILVSAITPSTVVEVFSADVDFSQSDGVLLLQSGYSLTASTNNTETFNIFAFYGNY